MSADGGTIDNLEDIVLGFDEDHYRRVRTIGVGSLFDYLITRYDVSLEFPLVFRQGDISVYKINRDEN